MVKGWFPLERRERKGSNSHAGYNSASLLDLLHFSKRSDNFHSSHDSVKRAIIFRLPIKRFILDCSIDNTVSFL